MDSSDESQARSPPVKGSGRRSSSSRASPSASPSAVRSVPLDKVETLSQMARLAPDLERRLRKGDVRPRELCEVANALARSKYFDPNLFASLAKELRRVFEKRQLGAEETLAAVCALAELNAYDAEMFKAACAVLRPELSALTDAKRQRLESALKQVRHVPNDDFQHAMKTRGRSDTREACPMFWRGQCKWGPRCKLSHDTDSFEGTIEDGKWRPPTQSGGKSVGYKQSADLFKADRCGALW